MTPSPTARRCVWWIGRRVRRLIPLLTICLATMGVHAQSSNAGQAVPTLIAKPPTVVRLSIDSTVTRKLLSGSSFANSQQLSAAGGPIAFSVAGSGINNNGGWIIDGKPVHVYLIWYGNWSGNAATGIIPSFVQGLNGTDYMNILTTYWGRDAQVRSEER